MEVGHNSPSRSTNTLADVQSQGVSLTLPFEISISLLSQQMMHLCTNQVFNLQTV